MRSFRKAGYDFVAITDHNMVTPSPDVDSIVTIGGTENDYGCRHLNRIGATLDAATPHEPSVVVEAGQKEGSFIVVNHPLRSGRPPYDKCWSHDDLLQLQGYHALEIWNCSSGTDARRFEQLVDPLLTDGKRLTFVAGDDCHDLAHGICRRSFVSVNANANTQEEIVASLKAGNFYTSIGPRITGITVSGSTLTVTLPEKYVVEFVVRDGRVAARHDRVMMASYEAGPADRYVRVRVTRPADGFKAWTNPVYVVSH